MAVPDEVAPALSSPGGDDSGAPMNDGAAATVHGWIITVRDNGESRAWMTTSLASAKERLASPEIQDFISGVLGKESPKGSAKVREGVAGFKGGEMAALPLGGDGRTGLFVQRQVFKM